jgi:nucleoside transporter
MKARIKTELSIMMFLEFFIWGAWFVTLGTYLSKGLKFDGSSIGNAYSSMPWGAIIAPFFVGMIADRFFSAQKVLGVCHILGGIVLFYAAGITSPLSCFAVLLIYALCYNPTLALVNAISFNQMENTEKEFPAIRVFGTLGWIAAGLLVGFLTLNGKGIEDTSIPMKIAAVASIVLGVYSFFLPKTPPKKIEGKVTISDVLGIKAFQLFKDRSFAIFMACVLLVCIPLSFYYNFTNLFLNEDGVANAAAKMTLGQMSEVFFMLVMPFFFARLGVKKMILFGMLAWAARYVLFAFGNPTNLVFMYYIGILVHGICYDFFFVTGQIYTDRVAPKHLRAQAQGLLVLFTLGLGMFIGAQIAGRVEAQHTTEESMAIAVQVTEKDDEIKIIKSQIADSPETPPSNLVLSLEEATAQRNELRHSELAAIDWKPLWLKPCLFAAAVLIIFIFFFRDSQPNNDEEDSASAPES